MGLLALVATAFGASCKRKAESGAPSAKATPCGGQAEGPIPWFKDAPEEALACAKATARPLVVDFWAPWCHTCLAMKDGVLSDARWASRADDFVWLALDTDREVNADFVKRFPNSVWPTFLALAADGSTVLGRHEGAATMQEFQSLLDRSAPEMELPAAALALRKADRLSISEPEHGGKALLYQTAFSIAEPRTPVHDAAALGVLRNSQREEHAAACSSFAKVALPLMGSNINALDAAFYAERCAQKAKDTELNRTLRTHTARLLAEAPLSVDDRAEALRLMRELHADEPKKAKSFTAEGRKHLLDYIRGQEEPTKRAIVAWNLLEVAKAGGTLKEDIGVLKEIADSNPANYDAAYRVAQGYHALGAHDKALKYANRAAEQSYGSRRLRTYALAAEVHKARGDKDAERETLEHLFLSVLQGEDAPAWFDAAATNYQKRLATLRAEERKRP